MGVQGPAARRLFRHQSVRHRDRERRRRPSGLRPSGRQTAAYQVDARAVRRQRQPVGPVLRKHDDHRQRPEQPDGIFRLQQRVGQQFPAFSEQLQDHAVSGRGIRRKRQDRGPHDAQVADAVALHHEQHQRAVAHQGGLVAFHDQKSGRHRRTPRRRRADASGVGLRQVRPQLQQRRAREQQLATDAQQHAANGTGSQKHQGSDRSRTAQERFAFEDQESDRPLHRQPDRQDRAVERNQQDEPPAA